MSKERFWERNVWIVWLVLVGATLTGYFIVEGNVSAKIAASAAFVLGAFKIHLIFGYFMELEWRHRPVRQILAVWLALVTLFLLTTYWLSIGAV